MEVKQKTITKEFTQKIYICKFCKQEFMHYENLKLHLEHHFPKESVCNFFNICSKCA